MFENNNKIINLNMTIQTVFDSILRTALKECNIGYSNTHHSTYSHKDSFELILEFHLFISRL